MCVCFCVTIETKQTLIHFFSFVWFLRGSKTNWQTIRLLKKCYLAKRERAKEIEKKIQSNIERNRQSMTLLSTSMFTNIKTKSGEPSHRQIAVKQEGGSYCKREVCIFMSQTPTYQLMYVTTSLNSYLCEFPSRNSRKWDITLWKDKVFFSFLNVQCLQVFYDLIKRWKLSCAMS